jgi:hypothetical protein
VCAGEPDGRGAGQAQGLSLHLCFGEPDVPRGSRRVWRTWCPIWSWFPLRYVVMGDDPHHVGAPAFSRWRGARWGCASPRRTCRTRKNTVIPSTGDERCWPVVPPLFATPSRCAAFAARRDDCPGRCEERRIARCIGPVTGAVFPGAPGYPSPPTARRSVVRGAARGSCSLAFLIPLRSDRGSLYPPCQVLVPVVASTT